MKIFKIKLAIEGFENPIEERDPLIPSNFLQLLNALQLTHFEGQLNIEDDPSEERFQSAIATTLEEAKKRIASVILKKTNIRIRYQRIKLQLVSVVQL